MELWNGQNPRLRFDQLKSRTQQDHGQVGVRVIIDIHHVFPLRLLYDTRLIFLIVFIR